MRRTPQPSSPNCFIVNHTHFESTSRLSLNELASDRVKALVVCFLFFTLQISALDYPLGSREYWTISEPELPSNITKPPGFPLVSSFVIAVHTSTFADAGSSVARLPVNIAAKNKIIPAVTTIPESYIRSFFVSFAHPASGAAQ
ncbi:MAG: hypothetical protein MUC65_07655 [Pontiellaceae bacterium]|jgi:hypothetical protein|nr:hypothetical protein [Pontiellaceae bacterium]